MRPFSNRQSALQLFTHKSTTSLVLLLLFHLPMNDAVECLEGADCVADGSCTACTGVACNRVRTFDVEANRHIALTCIPYDTRSHLHPLQLEAEGCRNRGTYEMCICYTDYCNAAETSPSTSSVVSLAALVLLRLLI